MRLGTIDGRSVLVTDHIDGCRVSSDGFVDVANASEGAFGPDPLRVLDQWPDFVDWARTRTSPLSSSTVEAEPLTLGPPVPNPRQVFAVALNYPLHAAEAGGQVPDQPLVFTKFPSCITGPEATVELSGKRVDWEVELVAVMGRETYRVPEKDAWSHVAGLMVGQDLSDRALQLAGTPPQFSLGKSFPGFGPTGPVLVTPDEFEDPDDLEVRCSIGSTTLQASRTSKMFFSVSDLVSRISASCRLLPGDLLFTGTPAGVGNRMDPPRFLSHGEQLVSRIAGLGEIVTYFRDAERWGAQS